MKVVFLHGFTQTARSWDRVISAMSTNSVDEHVAIDLPGHGDSPSAQLSLWDISDAIVAKHGRAIYVGYSFGARVALHIACRHPDSVTGLVLVSGSPGIADAEERRTRAAADDELAAHIEAVGVDTFLNEWLSLPLFATLSHEHAQLDDRRRNTSRGLADSLRHAGTGRQDSLWGHLSSVAVPTLLVTGRLDDKFCEIASRMSKDLPSAEWQIVDDAGHTVHLERPDQFVSLLTAWRQRTFSN